VAGTADASVLPMQGVQRASRDLGSGSVSAVGLTKAYPSTRGSSDAVLAVRGIDLDIPRGCTYGILGSNGAGKSSTMRMIACASPRTDGTLSVLGLDPRTDGAAIRARLGVVPQQDNLDLELTVFENLVIYARYFGIRKRAARDKADELLDFADLRSKAHARVDTLSGGMQRRLTIARALVNDPELVLLDEPTTGLDPQSRHALWDKLGELRGRGVGLLLTTHYMDEAEQLCDELVIMHAGRVVARGNPRDLIDEHVTPEVVEFRFSAGARGRGETVLQDLGHRVQVLHDRTLAYASDGDALVASVRRAGVGADSVFVRRATLEDVYLQITGRGISE